MNDLPLAGIRVADFGWIFAVPHTTSWLGALGADVIRIESPKRPDLVRFLGGTDGQMGINRSGLFHSINFSKRSIALDLTTNAGTEVARRLVSMSDIVTENFGTGVMTKFGLDYEKLRAVKPDIIMMSGTPLGQTGPLSGAIGYGPNSLAFSGISHLTGYPGGEPSGIGGTWPDFVVGVVMVMGVLAALHYRDRTGEGQYLDLSIAEMVTGMVPEAMMDFFLNEREQNPIGNRDPDLAPHGAFAVAGDDRWIAIVTVSDAEFASLCEVLEAPRLATDPRFKTMATRLQNVDVLEREISGLTRKFERDELVSKLRARGIAAGPMYNTAEIMADPAMVESGMNVEVEHKEVGRRMIPGLPVTFSGCKPNYYGGPAIGEHTDEVLTQVLGYSAEEIAQLREAGGVL
jgi:crotonobetainyl-CoA:carnitine CoA-transferase CaiB-like acyl-CoA transferase